MHGFLGFFLIVLHVLTHGKVQSMTHYSPIILDHLNVIWLLV
jgi:hypothetical protein